MKVKVKHNHKEHTCCTKVLFNMEPFVPTPQLGTEEGKALHTCCVLGCVQCSKACSVW